MTIDDMLISIKDNRNRDAETYKNLDWDVCMLCKADGADKRSLFMQCFYQLKEVIPEILDIFNTKHTDKGYFLRICKSCRGSLLGYLRIWRNERIALRPFPKNHDGYIDNENVIEDDRDIPVRIHGRNIMMNEVEYIKWKEGNQ